MRESGFPISKLADHSHHQDRHQGTILNSANPTPVIAVDVGNSRTKWGRFCSGQLMDVVSLPLDQAAYEAQAAAWNLLASPDRPASGRVQWCVASVNLDGSEPLLGWLHRFHDFDVRVLDDPAELPIRVELENPQGVGIDRLLNAVAVNARRPPGRSAIIVDAGSAITVDALNADGAFVGGAIAVGLRTAARALHEFTYWLPLLQVTEPPRPIGKSTADAMRSGLFWGTVGSINELLLRQRAALGNQPCVFLTGGDAPHLAPFLDQACELVNDLTLQGIQLTYEHLQSHRAR
jgi:type III pantothenate kinase